MRGCVVEETFLIDVDIVVKIWLLLANSVENEIG